MKDYSEYKMEDLVEDPGFREWVYKGIGHNEWNEWLTRYPDRRSEVETARNVLLSIRGELRSLPLYEVKTRVRAMLTSLSPEPEEAASLAWYRKYRWTAAAAVALLVLGFGWLQFSGKGEGFQNGPVPTASVPFPAAEAYEVIENSTGKQMLVNLPDGSSVLLMHKSEIRFPHQFDPEKREVMLKGEAFFEVQKDSDHPFLVYAGEMVTRVRGTSFRIQAYETDELVRVRVKTGSVTVSARSVSSDPSVPSLAGREELVLGANQQAVLSRSDLRLALLPAGKEDEQSLPIETQKFEFRRTAVSKVFETLEAVYQVDLQYDPDRLRECTITASLGDEPLKEKLNMICEIIGAVYTVEDHLVRISGDGCH